jgi:hypothetical protein
MLMAALLGTSAGAAAFAAGPASGAERLEYRIHHSKHGDIGTYTNMVAQNGDNTTVTTQGRIKVSVLGITAYRQEFDRLERWSNGKLVSFHGVTTENGKRSEVNGAADGNHFTVSTAAGMETAPTSVKPANPWSIAAISGDTMLTPDEGKIEKVRVGSIEETAVNINGQNVPTRHYQIQRTDGEKRYEVWFDREGTPVQFATVDPKDTVTFTLSACEGAAVCRVFKPEAIAQK